MSDDIALFVLRDHYPEDVFTPLSDGELTRVVGALTNCGVPYASDRLHAGWARHLAVVYEHYRDAAKIEENAYRQRIGLEPYP